VSSQQELKQNVYSYVFVIFTFYISHFVAVVAESSRKILAKEAAAQEFLKSLKDAESTLEIPPFKIPEACYYDPVICTRLEQLIASLSLDLRFEIVQTRLSRHDYFTTTYFVGEDAYEGELNVYLINCYVTLR
jgi:hypothetical protein